MKEIIMYTTTFCPFCVMAKKLLDRLNLPFKEVNLENDHEKRMQLSRENNSWRTVPMIFIGKEFIGGYQELAAIHRNGELQNKVQQ